MSHINIQHNIMEEIEILPQDIPKINSETISDIELEVISETTSDIELEVISEISPSQTFPTFLENISEKISENITVIKNIAVNNSNSLFILYGIMMLVIIFAGIILHESIIDEHLLCTKYEYHQCAIINKTIILPNLNYFSYTIKREDNLIEKIHCNDILNITEKAHDCWLNKNFNNKIFENRYHFKDPLKLNCLQKLQVLILSCVMMGCPTILFALPIGIGIIYNIFFGDIIL